MRNYIEFGGIQAQTRVSLIASLVLILLFLIGSLDPGSCPTKLSGEVGVRAKFR